MKPKKTNAQKRASAQERKYIDRAILHLGLFDNETDAARAYLDAASDLFGDFACAATDRGAP